MSRILPLGKGIKIYVSDRHRFGTDAILLADFARPKPSDIACDLGTGCGIIPLLWCRNNAPKLITAVDIQPDACDILRLSVYENMLNDRVTVVNADLRVKGAVTGTFNLVTMNPPYKMATDGLKCNDAGRRIARHEEECTLSDLTWCAARLLKFGGRLCICQRPDRLCDAVTAMRESGIEPKRLRMVCQRIGESPSLLLIEGKKGGKAGINILPSLIIEENGEYSAEMARIYSDYSKADQ